MLEFKILIIKNSLLLTDSQCRSNHYLIIILVVYKYNKLIYLVYQILISNYDWNNLLTKKLSLK